MVVFVMTACWLYGGGDASQSQGKSLGVEDWWRWSAEGQCQVMSGLL